MSCSICGANSSLFTCSGCGYSLCHKCISEKNIQIEIFFCIDCFKHHCQHSNLVMRSSCGRTGCVSCRYVEFKCPKTGKNLIGKDNFDETVDCKPPTQTCVRERCCACKTTKNLTHRKSQQFLCIECDKKIPM